MYDAGNCDAVPVLQRGAPHAVMPPMHNTGERDFCHDAIMRCARGVAPVQQGLCSSSSQVIRKMCGHSRAFERLHFFCMSRTHQADVASGEIGNGLGVVCQKTEDQASRILEFAV